MMRFLRLVHRAPFLPAVVMEIVAIAAVVAAATPLQAQRAAVAISSVAVGSRVRVTSPTMGRLTGSLLEAMKDSVVVKLDGGTARFAARDLKKLEVSRGYRREILKDATFGLLIGVGLGAAFTAATYADEICAAKDIGAGDCLKFADKARREQLRNNVATISLFTMIFGVAVGHVGRERWSKVALEPAASRVGLAIEPVGDHLAIGLAIAF